MDNRRLKARIMEKFGTQVEFANALGMSRVALCHKVNGKIEWRSSEIASACEILDIPLADAHLYFFTRRV